VHETLLSDTSSTPGGFEGVEVADQLDPFHSSATDPKTGEADVPTAMQNRVLVHETLESPDSPAGLGVTAQVEPFHVSIKGPFVPPPTAMQKETVGHDTPPNAADSSAGDEPESTDQLEPFHVSISALDAKLVPSLPTPTQNDTPTQETAVN